jgi:6-pyruvoyltetrahydropterin/6-carboxytetrahydropterin synthase
VSEGRLVRRVRFTATHHYRRKEWSDDENRRVFGAQAEPHAHDWVVEVHMAGEVDRGTGWVIDVGELDAVLAAVTEGWDGGDLNARVPPVADGTLMPSTENLARWIHGEVGRRIGGATRVVEVRVFESPDLGGAYPVRG